MAHHLLLLPAFPDLDWLDFLTTIRGLDPLTIECTPTRNVVLSFEFDEDFAAAILASKPRSAAIADRHLLIRDDELCRIPESVTVLATHRCFELWCPDDEQAEAIFVAGYDYDPGTVSMTP